MISLNTILNYVHEWSEPDQHPLKRIALTRIATLASSVIELGDIAMSTVHCGYQGAKSTSLLLLKGFRVLVLGPQSLQKYKTNTNGSGFKKSFILLCKLIAGLAFTLIIGVFLSPEINFRIHVNLDLIVNQLAIRKQSELQAKLDAEEETVSIAAARLARISQYQMEWKAAKEAEDKANAIDERLAEILLPGLDSRI